MFTPHVTVAAIVELDGHFLLVKEWVDGEPRYNQPAGHVEDGETIVEALVRETMEETGYTLKPEGLVGLYQWQSQLGETYFRYAFCGTTNNTPPNTELDPDIISVHWLNLAEIKDLDAMGQLRSPLVMACIQDYLQADIAPLSLLKAIK